MRCARLRTGFEPNVTIGCILVHHDCFTASPLLLQVETKLENYVRSQRTSRGGWGRKEVRSLVYGYWAQQAGAGPIIVDGFKKKAIDKKLFDLKRDRDFAEVLNMVSNIQDPEERTAVKEVRAAQ